MIRDYADFGINILVPAARAVLLEKFEAYKSGKDIDITGKKDGSPASRADREAESVMRDLIAEKYPSHGIIGEEHGSTRADAEYVWVLDPLDGTREFLDQQPGWCILIALIRNGKPVLGIIDDPLGKNTTSSLSTTPLTVKEPSLSPHSKIACTYPGTMFKSTPWETTAPQLLAAGKMKPRLNGIGFAAVAKGSIDLAVEASLKLHDIAALLPILWAAQAQTLRYDGSDYREHVFDLAQAGADYELLTGPGNGSIVAQAFEFLSGRP